MRILSLLFISLITSLLVAQEKPEKWDVNQPPGTYKEANFNLSEGTWMNLDVSPDGQHIVFDLLGDLYKMPSGGGKATILRSGLAWEVQPRFSPDGKHILFTSDAGGGDNIWSMKADGSAAKQITKEKFRLLNNADWIPNSDYFVARKHFTSTRSLGAGEMWMYHKSGGDGIQLTKRKNDQQDVNIYYSEDMYPGGFFQYNKNPNAQIYVIFRYDRETGETKQILGGPGGACRPQISPDGKRMAYIRRVREETVLFVHDLETGHDYPLFNGLSKDQTEAWAIFGAYTGFDWMPDGKEIVIWGKGKIWKVETDSKRVTKIPFQITANHKFAETVLFEQEVAPEEFDIKVIRQLVTAPDGKTVVFNALGSLWQSTVPNGKPKRITEEGVLGFEPSFSPDGKSIVYVTWEDEDLGQLMKMNLASNATTVLNETKGIYRTPRFNPEGTKIVYRKEGGNTNQGFVHTKEPGLYLIDADGGTPTLITPEGEQPYFAKSIWIKLENALFLIPNILINLFQVQIINGSHSQNYLRCISHRCQRLVRPLGYLLIRKHFR